MMPLRVAASRIPASRIATVTQTRLLSSQTSVAVEKLRSVLEEYRLQNYTQEIPSRFKKDICRAAAVQKDSIAYEGMQRVLANIGLSHRLSEQEIKAIFEEIGNECGEISSQTMAQIL